MKVLKLEPRWVWALADLVSIYACWGHAADAQRTLNELLAYSKHSHVSKYSLATVYAALGDKARALDELEHAYAARAVFMALIRADAELDSLRSEPRFQKLVRQMNFPQ